MNAESLKTGTSIGEYLIRRLRDYGIGTVFGIPGDYVLSFYSMLEKSPIKVVGCTREDCAGFAADAYARIHGMGAVCVDVLRGGAEHLQFDCRGIRREISRRCDFGFSGIERASE